MGPDGMTLNQERDATVATFKLPSDGLYTLVVSLNEPTVTYAFNVTIR